MNKSRQEFSLSFTHLHPAHRPQIWIHTPPSYLNLGRDRGSDRESSGIDVLYLRVMRETEHTPALLSQRHVRSEDAEMFGVTELRSVLVMRIRTAKHSGFLVLVSADRKPT